MRHSIFVFCVFFIHGCAFQNDKSDLERTWESAVVTLPPKITGQPGFRGRIGQRETSLAIRGRRFPLVLYLHGCTGIGNFFLFDVLASEGYAVIAPDSFARRFRPLQCDPNSKQGGQNLFVYDFRLAEITYALEQIAKLSWVDYQNLFLFGVSEGGVAAALFRGDVFNARIIAQWTCNGAPLVEGLDAPKREAILAIVREADPYYGPSNTPAQEGNCGDFFLDRPGSQSIVLPAHRDSSRHDVLASLESLDIITVFLRQHLR